MSRNGDGEGVATKRKPFTLEEIEAMIEKLPAHVRPLAAKGQVCYFKRHGSVIDEGSYGDAVYVLLHGRVKAFSRDFNDRAIRFATDQAGEIFGEMALDGRERSASVVALEDTVCMAVTMRDTWSYARSSPDFAEALIRKLIARARWTTDLARELALSSVYVRLVALLNKLALPPDATGARCIPEKMTQLEISERIGSSREMVNKLMKDLEKGGYLCMRDERICLLKKLPPRW